MTHTGFTPGLSLWLNLAYDTGVFVAISVRLSSYRLLPSNASLLSSFRGDGLPLAMRYFLRDGQLYYLFAFFLLPVLVCFDDIFLAPQ